MQYPKSEGAVFINQRKQNEKHPDWRGHVTITSDQIKMLIKMARAGQEVKLQLAMWDRTAKQTGAQYKHVSAEAYMNEERAGDQYGQGAPQYPQQAPQQQYQQPAPQQPQYPQQAPQQPPQNSPTFADFEDDDIPFN